MFNFDFSLDSYDTSTTGNSPSWPDFQFDPSSLTFTDLEVPTITVANDSDTNPDSMQHAHQLTFDHLHSFSATTSLQDLTTTPTPSPFDSTTAHAPSLSTGSPTSSTSPEEAPPFPHTPTPQHPGLSLPKGNPHGKPKRGRPPSSTHSGSPNEFDVLVKRQRNNVAAKKYRQKKVDRITELEEEVDEVKKERDELRILLARQEAETKALREMLKLRMKGDE